MIAALLDITVDEVRMLDKNQPLEALCGKTLREGLQLLGTEWGRDLVGKTVWVDNARLMIEKRVGQAYNVVVDDCRFRNEYDMLIGLGAKIVLVERQDVPVQHANHGSEVEWKSFDVHARVVNDAADGDEWLRRAGETVLAAL
jgi:hypothetical protein